MKNTRNMCTAMAAMKINAAQWCIWRRSRPPRMSKEMSREDAYASDILMPCRGTYEPS